MSGRLEGMKNSVGQRLSIDLIRQRQLSLKPGDVLYLGDMSSRRHIFNQIDHSKCVKHKEYLGSQYSNLDGSLAYIEVFSCQYCRLKEHCYSAAVRDNGEFVGFMCAYCSKIREEMTQEELNTYHDIMFEGRG